MPQSTELALSLAKLCADQTPANLPAFVETLNTLSPGPVFHHALTRGGWYRPGGVVSADGERVADSIGEWAEREAEGDVLRLLARYADDGLLATRLDGQTHYFVARLGEGPAEFLQLEVEELREVVDRPLVIPGWIPDNLGEFLDPFEYPRLEPRSVGNGHYQFRRLFDAAGLLGELETRHGSDLPVVRFVADWKSSSAGENAPLCEHWILALRDAVDRYGDTHLSVRPIPMDTDVPRLRLSEPSRGTLLANQIHAFDRSAGYPFAWYFWMLGSRRVPHELAAAVHRDLMGAFDYLPPRDLKVLGRWSAHPYCT